MVLFPIVLSIVGTIFLFFDEDTGMIGRLIAAALTGASIALQFVPAFHTHFLIPLAMQLFVCFWVALKWRKNQVFGV